MVKRSRTKSQEFKKDWRGLDARQQSGQMCLIHRDFKHFYAAKAKDFRVHRKLPSIM
jgi:hypothetical protein